MFPVQGNQQSISHVDTHQQSHFLLIKSSFSSQPQAIPGKDPFSQHDCISNRALLLPPFQ